MGESECFTLRLAKRDFQFSVAHFTIFGPERAESLHGHNYRVRVEFEGSCLDEAGLVVDVGPVKQKVRQLCRELDERVLLPERSPWLRLERREGKVAVQFGERAYAFPEKEVRFLPLENISMELLARHLWEQLAEELEGAPVEALAVEIEETDGQSCRYRRDEGA